MWRPIRKSRKSLCIGFAMLLVLVAAASYLFDGRRGPVKSPAPGSGPPPLSDSPFLNASPAVECVGVATCAERHAEQHRSYLETAHSRALADVDVSAEPADASFLHPRSGRSYSVYRDDDRFHHRESLEDAGGTELIVADFPIWYLIGSGRHTRSYLVEDAGFLMESPLTWYASRKRWDMSPGYDLPQHWGFERAADVGCLVCHVGEIKAPDETYQKLDIREQAIGCERCHGPGALHVAEQRERQQADDVAQSRAGKTGAATIVHPGRLTRPLGEAICAQCHLRGDASVPVRGRGPTDFRPGRPLTDYRVDYLLDAPGSRMKVVGHVEQMHQSRCYSESGSLTCTTCHNPHAPRAADENHTQFVLVCATCHAEGSCRIDPAERRRQNPANDCVACHMPRVATDIPHIAFTHHRIAVHSKEEESRPLAGPGTLVPFEGVSHLPEIDRDRNLGLACLEFADKQSAPQSRQIYRARAVSLLEGVRRRGLSDPEVTAALARIYWEDDPQRSLELAREGLRSARLSARSRVNALFVVGDAALRTNQIEPAVMAFEELVGLRRHSEDWLLLGKCRQHLGDLEQAQRDLGRAAAIAPFRPEIREALAEIYDALGDAAEASRQRTLAGRLSRLIRTP